MPVSRRTIVILTLVLTVVFPLSAWVIGGIDASELSWQLPLIAVNTLPLILIRRNPLLVVLIFSVAYPTWIVAGGEGHLLQALPTLVAMYALGAWDRPLRVRVIGLIAPLWMLGSSISGWWSADPLEIAFVAVVFIVVWVLGVLLADRRSYSAQLEAKTARLERAERELAERAVVAERNRIARELHDVIAHAMSVITVQAGVGAHLIGSDPGQAARSLSVIEHTGREALLEMRRMLAVLQSSDEEAIGTGPQPGLASLPQLIERLGHAGVEATLEIEGATRALPAGLDLAAYRVTQEALTNIAKHAPGATAAIEILYLPEWLQIVVRNRLTDGNGEVVPGQGLRGMRERVDLYDGNLRTAIVDGEFRIEAKFPTGVTT